jgi:hypothetical protein
MLVLLRKKKIIILLRTKDPRRYEYEKPHLDVCV